MRVDPLPRRSPRLQRLKAAGTNKTQELGSKRGRSVDKDGLVRLWQLKKLQKQEDKTGAISPEHKQSNRLRWEIGG